MEIDAMGGTTTLVKTTTKQLEFQRQGRCWGCGQLGHIQARCPTNPSKSLSLVALAKEDAKAKESEKGWA